jgi:hypothetical protein
MGCIEEKLQEFTCTEKTESVGRKKTASSPRVLHGYGVFKHLHNKYGHPGRERALSLIRDRVYRNRVFKDTENWIKNCQICVLGKTPTNQCAPLTGVETTYTLEIPV